jgi:hypothetical protein
VINQLNNEALMCAIVAGKQNSDKADHLTHQDQEQQSADDSLDALMNLSLNMTRKSFVRKKQRLETSPQRNQKDAIALAQRFDEQKWQDANHLQFLKQKFLKGKSTSATNNQNSIITDKEVETAETTPVGQDLNSGDADLALLQSLYSTQTEHRLAASGAQISQQVSLVEGSRASAAWRRMIKQLRFLAIKKVKKAYEEAVVKRGRASAEWRTMAKLLRFLAVKKAKKAFEEAVVKRGRASAEWRTMAKLLRFLAVKKAKKAFEEAVVKRARASAEWRRMANNLQLNDFWNRIRRLVVMNILTVTTERVALEIELRELQLEEAAVMTAQKYSADEDFSDDEGKDFSCGNLGDEDISVDKDFSCGNLGDKDLRSTRRSCEPNFVNKRRIKELCGPIESVNEQIGLFNSRHENFGTEWLRNDVSSGKRALCYQIITIDDIKTPDDFPTTNKWVKSDDFIYLQIFDKLYAVDEKKKWALVVVTGDGSCFFHCGAAHMIIQNQIPSFQFYDFLRNQVCNVLRNCIDDGPKKQTGDHSFLRFYQMQCSNEADDDDENANHPHPEIYLDFTGDVLPEKTKGMTDDDLAKEIAAFPALLVERRAIVRQRVVEHIEAGRTYGAFNTGHQVLGLALLTETIIKVFVYQNNTFWNRDTYTPDVCSDSSKIIPMFLDANVRGCEHWTTAVSLDEVEQYIPLLDAPPMNTTTHDSAGVLRTSDNPRPPPKPKSVRTPLKTATSKSATPRKTATSKSATPRKTATSKSATPRKTAATCNTNKTTKKYMTTPVPSVVVDLPLCTRKRKLSGGGGGGDVRFSKYTKYLSEDEEYEEEEEEEEEHSGKREKHTWCEEQCDDSSLAGLTDEEGSVEG